MDGECMEMDLSIRQRDPQVPDSCKVRVAKSVFSIRSLVDLGENAEKTEEDNTNATNIQSDCKRYATIYLYWFAALTLAWIITTIQN